MREYALEQLENEGEGDAARRRLASWCVRLAEQAERELMGPQSARWLNRLDQEHDNLRAALIGARDDAEIERGLRLAASLWRFWETRGFLVEGRDWLDQFISAAERTPGVASREAYGAALRGAGGLSLEQNDADGAVAYYTRALTVAEQAGDAAAIASILGNLGLVAELRADYAEAIRCHSEALASKNHLLAGTLDAERRDRLTWSLANTLVGNLGRLALLRADYGDARRHYQKELRIRAEEIHPGEIRDPLGYALALNALGEVELYAENFDEADRLLAQSLALIHTDGAVAEDIDDKRNLAYIYNNLGDLRLLQGDLDAAAVAQERSRALRAEMQTVEVAVPLRGLGDVAMARRDYHLAAGLYEEALAIARTSPDPVLLLPLLERVAYLGVAKAEGHLSHAEEAVRLLGAVEARRCSLGLPLHQVDMRSYEKFLALLRDELGEAMFMQAWDDGYKLNRDEVIGDASKFCQAMRIVE